MFYQHVLQINPFDDKSLNKSSISDLFTSDFNTDFVLKPGRRWLRAMKNSCFPAHILEEPAVINVLQVQILHKVCNK